MIELIYLRSFQGCEHIVLVRRNKLIKRRLHIIIIGNREIVLRELPGEISLFIERVGYLTFAIKLLAVCSVCQISRPKEMRMQMGSRQSRYSETQMVVVVMRNNRVDRSEVKLVVLNGIRSFNKVLNQRLHTYHDIFEAFDFRNLLNERAHFTLTLSQFHLSILVPIGIIRMHRSIRFRKHTTFHMLEHLLGNRSESIVKIAN